MSKWNYDIQKIPRDKRILTLSKKGFIDICECSNNNFFAWFYSDGKRVYPDLKTHGLIDKKTDIIKAWQNLPKV